ncbi:uncharacterized protein LOC129247117 [Anastrepha obliqua]|uniref:uncharacterized protein LOC129247117 n=1 Tax=Anastrepha obliqua TaxID=95512 RepID=UPI00240A4B6B|nr:uncharacterized protein LOC129247117 [Anastrepha obliqua]
MVKTIKLSIEIGAEIINKFKNGISASDLAKFYQTSRKPFTKKETYGNLANKARTARKPITNYRDSPVVLPKLIGKSIQGAFGRTFMYLPQNLRGRAMQPLNSSKTVQLCVGGAFPFTSMESSCPLTVL